MCTSSNYIYAMARCMGTTKDGKRCGNGALDNQTFCRLHLKNSKGKSRRLTAPKCQTMRKTRKSPYSSRKLKKDGRTYGQIYTVCRQRMDHLVKRLEARKDLPENLAKYAKSLKKEWFLTRKVTAAKSS